MWWTGRPGVARLQLGRTPAKTTWYRWKQLRVRFYRCFRAVSYLYPFRVLWHSLVSVALSLSAGFVSLVKSESVRDREWFTGSGNSVDSERVRASVKEECAPALLGSRNISVLAPNASVARRCRSSRRPTCSQADTSSLLVRNVSVARRSDFHPGRPPELWIPRQFFPERHEV